MSKVALLSVDFQKGFDDPIWGTRNNPDAEVNIAALLAHWRQQAWPIIHVQHCSVEPNSPLRPGVSGNEFIPEAKPLPGEQVFSKTVNSAFIGTDLKQYLRDNDIGCLVIAGLTTDHCVSTTTRMAGNFGFDVILVSDATATFDRKGEGGTHYSAEQIHNIHLASLNGEFCTVQTCTEVLSRFVSGRALL